MRAIASGLRDPSGVAFRDGALYVSAVSRILRFDDIERRLDDPPAPVVVTDRYPGDAHHGRKFIAFGPDGKLYVPIGAPCNICEATADRHSVITRINPDGSGYEVVARGVRNTVGFDFHPVTKELWFTDNGRDWLGDDRPPCELNRLQKAGQHFGFPYCHGSDVADPDYGGKRACSEFEAPVQNLGAHVAPLGMRFYTGTQFPAAYRGQVFIAEHGSWNRSRKIGYRVMLVRLDANGKALAYEPFAQGWLDGERAWGRPADVSVGPDGSLLRLRRRLGDDLPHPLSRRMSRREGEAAAAVRDGGPRALSTVRSGRVPPGDTARRGSTAGRRPAPARSTAR